MKTFNKRLSSNLIPKIDCPYCGAKKHWQRYIDLDTGYIYPSEFGKCDNELKCGKWIKPNFNQFLPENYQNRQKMTKKLQITTKNEQKQTYIPTKVYQCFLNENAKQNRFIQNLEGLGVPENKIREMLEMYYVGMISGGEMKGATTIPFINIDHNIVAVQVKHFNENNKTDKTKRQHTNYLHSVLSKEYYKKNKNIPNWLKSYQNNTEKVTCLFGEHLLNRYPNNTIAMVEAPKTAIYGTLYLGFPDEPNNYLWLATGSFSYLTLKRLSVLQGRQVVLFPDLSSGSKAFETWKEKAVYFSNEMQNTQFYVNNYLEKFAGDCDRINGNDLADYLHSYNWVDFQNSKR